MTCCCLGGYRGGPLLSSARARCFAASVCFAARPEPIKRPVLTTRISPGYCFTIVRTRLHTDVRTYERETVAALEGTEGAMVPPSKFLKKSTYNDLYVFVTLQWFVYGDTSDWTLIVIFVYSTRFFNDGFGIFFLWFGEFLIVTTDNTTLSRRRSKPSFRYVR